MVTVLEGTPPKSYAVVENFGRSTWPKAGLLPPKGDLIRFFLDRVEWVMASADISCSLEVRQFLKLKGA